MISPASIRFTAATKRFADAEVVSSVSLDIPAGEFTALLGPSGCGKTTLLRMIAGFETMSEGTLHFGDRLVAGAATHVPPEDRGVAIVFQSYALWPHMSVGENVGYPLRVRGLPRAEQKARIAEALLAVDLEGFEARRPADLSGGQRQRVALARCFAMEPSIVLLDEPLANLDVHLRASMEETFRQFHRRTGATMVYVTHDQAEAMAMADRIAVMQKGRLLEVAAPAELYARPRTEAVARFVGNGRIVECRIAERVDEGRRRVEVLGTSAVVRSTPDAPARAETARLCLRAEGLALAETGGFEARVLASTFKGAYSLLVVELLAAPALSLSLSLHAPTPGVIGSIVRVAITDGWILPLPPSAGAARQPVPVSTPESADA
ncbi:ABC transporter ATP-binding protein [Aureimonas pseudogalii]|uniref:Iron(III) transport system ATP-binding protein n=1 Tax=Aureimonas pseudogalii TaxID=1744844 RepID=A0A7W6EF99_9HYPH|nr:ABC transporter ATP-binding protein [Aureimonas pseudogalii]MBB3998337.1 iron(III) transport system ATP-binding protein [Aureimonas pseudogalii]